MNSDGRSPELDVIKGMLVVVMLLYHNVTVSRELLSAGLWEEYLQRISFIHSAFIIVSGYLCGWHYLPVLGRNNVRSRLAMRGIKLFLVLAASNIALYAAGLLDYGQLSKVLSADNGILMNLVLNPNGDIMAFEILYPIALLLVVASVVIGRLPSYALAVLVLAASFYIPPLGMPKFLFIGLVGFAAGMAASEGRFMVFSRALTSSAYMPAMLAAMAAYQLLFNPIHSFSRFGTGAWLLIYGFTTLLWFMAFIGIPRVFPDGQAARMLTPFARYTLVAYMVQMLLIRIGYMALTRMGITGWQYYFINLITRGALLYIILIMLDAARRRNSMIDRAYRAVFA